MNRSIPPATVETQVNLPPLVYHLAEADNWASIQERGLLSAGRLLGTCGVPGFRLDGSHRLSRTTLPNGCVVRDQKRIPSAALEKCLVALTPGEWYAMLNMRVFFWLDRDRLDRQRIACGPHPQVVMVVDVERLVARHHAGIELTPINTGNARRKPALRGRATFVPYREWLSSGWSSEAAALNTKARPHNHRPVELTVVDAVPDVMRLVTRVVELKKGELLRDRF
jgi:hypothetical protein